MLKGRDIIVFLAIKYNGDWNSIYQAIKNKEFVDEQVVNETIAQASKFKVITIIDDEYPENLKKMYKPPFVLFMDKQYLRPLQRSEYTLGIMDAAKKYNHESIATLSTMLNQILDVNNTQLCGIDHQEIFEMGVKIKRSDNPRHIRVLTYGIENAVKQDNVINVSEYLKGPSKEENMGWASRLLVGISNAFYTPNIAKGSSNQIGIGYSLYLGKTIMMDRSTTKASMDLFKTGGVMIDSYQDMENAMYHSAGSPKPDKTKLEGSPLV
jgi:DNA processing protein